FGSDARAERDESWLDPKSEPAKIRAFFVDPEHARHGIGRAILARSEAEAIRAGFSSFELMATLPGVRLYAKYGYVPGPALDHPLSGGPPWLHGYPADREPARPRMVKRWPRAVAPPPAQPHPGPRRAPRHRPASLLCPRPS